MGRRTPGSRTTHCGRCGYDLQGSNPDVCTECGATVYENVGSYTDEGGFRTAAATLAEAGIDHRAVEHKAVGDPLTHMMGAQVPFGTGLLLVSRRDLDRALALLEQLDAAPVLPIVDRAEPQCPTCDHTLDPDETPVCPACGARFTWVEIGETDGAEEP